MKTNEYLGTLRVYAHRTYDRTDLVQRRAYVALMRREPEWVAVPDDFIYIDRTTPIAKDTSVKHR